MTFQPKHAVVWTEIPVSDLPKAVKFYNDAMDYGMSIDDSGPNPIAFIPYEGGEAVAGHLYPGKPGAGVGPTVHLAVPGALEDAVKQWVAAGGLEKSPPIDIPFGRFAYVEDPDGNSIGLFEAKAA